MAHIDRQRPVLERPSIVKLEQQSAVVIRLVVPRPEIRAMMAPAIAELNEVLRAQGIEP